MGLKCGIIGLPNVGKSTLFNCLTNANVLQENYPFCTIEPNVGVVQVPDKRLHKLSDIVKPQKIIPTTIEFVDIAGLVRGASKGEGLGNQFLGYIRNCDMIIHVIRCFEDNNISHVEGVVDPIRDKNIIDLELQLRDLETIEKWQKKYSIKAKFGKREDREDLAYFKKIHQFISTGKNAKQMEMTVFEKQIVGKIQLLTMKPQMYIFNVDEQHIRNKNPLLKKIIPHLVKENSIFIKLSVQTEAEINQLESDEERKFFLSELGLQEPGIYQLIKGAYKLLNLETFFTITQKIVQAWTFKRGQTAKQCAGIIHTDFAKGFIKAEVIKFKDYLTYRSTHACRENGKIALEGKNYKVEDGDIIRYRFNV